MSYLLSIETAVSHLGLSIFKWGPQGKAVKVASYHKTGLYRQADVLFPVLDKLLKKGRVQKKDLSAIAVDIGPGSFTGVRVGVATARALGQALGAYVVGIPSLEIMAHSYFATKPKSGRLASVLQALENEVYAAVYEKKKNGTVVPLVSPRWISSAELNVILKKYGPVAKTMTPPDPQSLATLAIQKLSAEKKKSQFDFNEVEPLYLQPSWAERSAMSC